MKKLAVTMGDLGGVGPEIIVKALQSPAIKKSCIPIVIGNASVIEEALKLCKSPLSLQVIRSPEEAIATKGLINIIHVISPKPPFPHPGGFPPQAGRRGDAEAKQKLGKEKSKGETFNKNKPTAEGGRACVSYIRKAAEFALSRQVDGIVTAPISKEALKMAGLKWPGHTEMLADLTKTRDYAMMLVGGPLRVILVTIHTALKNVPDLITRQRIVKTICLAQRACDMLRIKKPKIAVAGLNPHAGEAGIFGDEEIEKIIPGIRQAMNEGIPVSGPYPPDTIFHKAYKGEVDIIVCMYHDQGLIPLKMIAFDKGVNVTVGLPFIRTSPDHGTAYDIAWKGKANPSSMIEAIRLAVKLKV
jgi:4-hydroxythreonine-4-phosphate dehydrogenase